MLVRVDWFECRNIWYIMNVFRVGCVEINVISCEVVKPNGDNAFALELK